MREKQKRFLAGIMLVLFLLLLACNAAAPIAAATDTLLPPTATLTATPEPTPTSTSTPVPPVSISGVITNLGEAKQYLSDKSFLQLVRVTDEGKVSIVFPPDGGIYLDSDLIQIPIPSADGFFEFKMDSIAAGKYFISAQKFNPPNGMNFNAMIIGSDPKAPSSAIAINIPADVKLPYSLNLGEVILILP